MRKCNLLIIAGLIALLAAGCGQTNTSANDQYENTGSQQTDNTSKPEDTSDENGTDEDNNTIADDTAAEDNTSSEDNTTAEDNTTTEDNTTAENNSSAEDNVTYTDNFAVDAEAAADFANKIKDVVANKDLEALADLAFFPMYVRFSDGGQSLESREDFIALGADKIFTDELLTAIAEAPTDNLSASRAGFVLTKQSGSTNIVFGVVNGKLAVQSINY